MSKKQPFYTTEFRQQVLELVAAGRNPSELAREFGVHPTTISGWVCKANADSHLNAKPSTAVTHSHIAPIPPGRVRESIDSRRCRHLLATRH